MHFLNFDSLFSLEGIRLRSKTGIRSCAALQFSKVQILREGKFFLRNLYFCFDVAKLCQNKV